MSKEYKVFVYGTLRQGDVRNGVLKEMQELGQAEFIKKTTTSSVYTLVDLGAFPGLIEGGDTSVVGEIWEIDQYTKQYLDLMEGVPILYQDKPVKIDDEEDIFAYFLVNPRGYPEIKTGDWFKKD
jgi:gamma-glutamylcyclotransferase (GGCT)/AIG2-like uncharacterized protein YtfP